MNKREWDSLSGLEKRTVIAERKLEGLEKINTDLLRALKQIDLILSSRRTGKAMRALSVARAAHTKAKEVP